MNKKLMYFIAVLAGIAIFVGIYFLYGELSSQYTPDNIAVSQNNSRSKNNPVNSGDTGKEKNYEVSNFTVYSSDGKRVELWNCIGKPIILNFWASWCGPCQSEMPEFEAAFKENPDIMFMMVNVTTSSYETISSAKEFIDDSGYTFPVYYDIDGEAAERYGINAIPATFLIDKNGHLVASVTGSMGKEDMEECLSLLRGEEELIIQ